MLTRRETLRGGSAAVAVIAVTGPVAAAVPAIAKSSTSRDLPTSVDEPLLDLEREWNAVKAERDALSDWCSEQYSKLPDWAKSGPETGWPNMDGIPEFEGLIGTEELPDRPHLFEVEGFNRRAEIAARGNRKLLAQVKAEGRARVKAYEARTCEREALLRDLGIEDEDGLMEPYSDRMLELEYQIADLPALTVAGIAVKLRFWAFNEGPLSGKAEFLGDKLALSALKDSERLAGEVTS